MTTWPDGSTSDEVTDRLGRITEKTDQNGNSMTFDYDALGRLLGVTDALNQVTTYSYDEVGNKLSQTDAENRTTSWTYDALGRELTRTLPLGQIESQQYDAVGNREQITDFNGQVTTYGYDNMYRPDTVTYNDATFETYSYDDHGNRTSATDRNGAAQAWAYDNRHRLTRVTDAAGNQIDYGYDDAGNKSLQTTTPIGEAAQVTAYGYDVLNRLQSVTDVNLLLTAYTYDANGNRASVTYPNGNLTTYVYDLNNRLTRQTTETTAAVLLADYQYTLDPSGHRLQIDEPGRSTTYTYDDSYKLLTEDIVDPVNGDHSSVYEYDAVGNRTYSTINGVQTLYTYDDNDRLLQQGGEVFTYDANGNTLTKTIDGFVSTYTYDAKNHMAGGLLNDAGAITSSTYRYDVDGIRIGKTEGVDTTDYLIDPNRDYAQVVRETDGAGVSIDYLYGDDLIQQSQAASNERYYLYDGLGSTRFLTDGVGAITDAYDYEAFGSVLNQTGVTENDYRFTGEQYDQGLDQYYLRARYYDQGVGRFTQMDTFIGDNQDPVTLHKYLYANVDPINNIDPSGKFSIGSVMSALNTAATLANIATTTFDLLQVASGQKEASGLEIGFSVLASFGGGKLFSLLGKKVLKSRGITAAAVSCSGSRNSFIAGTLVKTEDWFLPIELVRIGDKVWSYNTDLDLFEMAEVTHFIVGQGEYDATVVKLSDNVSFTATNSHALLVDEYGWKVAQEILPGNRLTSKKGTVEVVDKYSIPIISNVYNLTVAGNHNYLISKEEVVVHNCPDLPFGALGRKIFSKTVWKSKGKIKQRIDFENPNPGQRAGQIHFQQGNKKYLYDPEKKIFIGAPRKINKLLKNPSVEAAIRKALRFLGES